MPPHDVVCVQGREEEEARAGPPLLTQSPEQQAAALNNAPTHGVGAGSRHGSSGGSGLVLPWPASHLSPRAVWGYPPSTTRM